MKEYAIQFGPNRQLTGVVTVPRQRRQDLACVLVTAGLTPKSGPFRLYTMLARRLSEDGFVALRFDLGSIGDSGCEITGVPLTERTNKEIRLAVDAFCQQHRLNKVVLCGLCSGAEAAFRYATLDDRVAGVTMIDSFAYRTRGWAWRFFLYRVRRRLLRALGIYRTLDSYADARAKGDAGVYSSLIDYRYMERGESEDILADLLHRKVRVHFVYTGAMQDRFNHRGQLRKMFPNFDLGGLACADYLPKCEHTPVLSKWRDAMINTIAANLNQAFAGERIRPVR